MLPSVQRVRLQLVRVRFPLCAAVACSAVSTTLSVCLCVIAPPPSPPLTPATAAVPPPCVAPLCLARSLSLSLAALLIRLAARPLVRVGLTSRSAAGDRRQITSLAFHLCHAGTLTL